MESNIWHTRRFEGRGITHNWDVTDVAGVGNPDHQVDQLNIEPFFKFERITTCDDMIIFYNGTSDIYIYIIDNDSTHLTLSDKYLLDLAIEEYCIDLK